MTNKSSIAIFKHRATEEPFGNLGKYTIPIPSLWLSMVPAALA